MWRGVFSDDIAGRNGNSPRLHRSHLRLEVAVVGSLVLFRSVCVWKHFEKVINFEFGMRSICCSRWVMRAQAATGYNVVSKDRKIHQEKGARINSARLRLLSVVLKVS
jgi:hypothetical protein